MATASVIALGDVRTVLRLPPSPFNNRNGWAQKKSDILAHFLQVSALLSNSSWMKSPCTFTIQGDKVLKSQFASGEAFVYAAVYFRQLYADDSLFLEACRIYQEHSGDPAKVFWVKEELESFRRTLAGDCIFSAIRIPLRDLIDAFLYGALLFHGPNKAFKIHRRLFQSVITGHLREEILYSLNMGMTGLCSHASGVAMVLHKDMAHWQHSGWIPAPNVWWHSRLFGQSS